jgi:hypothetical protein
MKNLGLVIASLLLSILLIEIILKIQNKYNYLTKNELIASDSVYERPFNSKQKHKHPDLNYIIQNYFDMDGVKNFSKIETSQKKNLIGMFGDSFIENIAVDRIFEYSTLLNENINNYQVINYGIGGYSAELAFLRYLKYQDKHDLKYVFYMFFPGDQKSKSLINFHKNGSFEVKKNKINLFIKLISKLNLTYFLIDIFYKIRSFLFEDHSLIDINNYSQVLANRIAKKNYNELKEDSEYFYKLLNAFQNEVKKNNGKFFVIIFPDKNNINYFEKTIKNYNLKINYFILDSELAYSKELFFINDGHWNEKGNLLFAKNLEKIFDNSGIHFNKKIDENIIIFNINNYYKN